MAIYRLLQNSPTGPEQIRVLQAAYDQTLRALHLKDRNDPMTEIAQTGVRDSAQISSLAIKQLGIQ
jgi:hypothetical protein